MAGPAERLRYLDLLGRVAGRVDAEVLAWSLMSSHVHVVVRAGEDPLSELFKPVNTGFAAWLNRSRGHIGPVFADRYKAILVETEPYLLALVGYVHNNPVRAGLVQSAEQSDWTSHRAYLGLEPAPDWLNTTLVLEQFSRAKGHARRMFNDHVLACADEGRREDLSDGAGSEARNKMRRILGDGTLLSDAILGSEAFAEEVIAQMEGKRAPVLSARGMSRHDLAALAPGLDDVMAAACAAVGVEPWVFDHRPKARLSARARRLLAYTWIHRCAGRQVEIARHFNVASSLVSRWYTRAVDNLPELEDDLHQMQFLLEQGSPKQVPSEARRTRYAVVMDGDPTGEASD